MFDPNRPIRAMQDVAASCHGKHPYPHRFVAQQVIDRRRRHNRDDMRGVKPYPCRYGRHWHIGSATDDIA